MNLLADVLLMNWVKVVKPWKTRVELDQAGEDGGSENCCFRAHDDDDHDDDKHGHDELDDDDEKEDDDNEHLGERCSGMPPSLLMASTSPAGVTWWVSALSPAVIWWVSGLSNG